MYDVMVIGGGSGGYAAAIRASQLGGKVVLVEAAEIGGTCVNRGCIPSKVWLRAAYVLHLVRNADAFGIKATVQGLDLQAIVARKNGVSGDIRMGMEGLLKNNGVEVIRGRAVLKSSQEIIVDDDILKAKKIILATGSALYIPDVPGLENATLTTDQVLEMTEAPSSVLIWGDIGPIEVEMASLLNTFGSKVFIASNSRRILPREDGDTSQRVAQSFREQGIELLSHFTLQSVKKSGGGFNMTSDIGLDQAGVRLNEDGSVWVNERLETSVAGIYAIGDATGGWMLSHASSSMAVTAAENSMGNTRKFPFHLVPRGIWTIPQVGSVGLSEEDAEEKGIDVEVGDFPYSINGLAMVRDEMIGAVKIVSDPQHGEILGVHIVGANATELVGEAVLAMQLEATTRELAYSIRMHPTFSESVVDATRDALNWALYLPKR
ncbi:MAG: dihydrolipoamide dehydrogenase [Desulfobacterium sp. 4572_20]|nr:MAG: dihydrolipoamide dehydrogenase [Desulfobacterium sp. 4572_20]